MPAPVTIPPPDLIENPLLKAQLGSVVRAILQACGVVGVTTLDTWTGLTVSILLIVGPLVWSYIKNRQQVKAQQQAAATLAVNQLPAPANLAAPTLNQIKQATNPPVEAPR